jgi:hypothetical protein
VNVTVHSGVRRKLAAINCLQATSAWRYRAKRRAVAALSFSWAILAAVASPVAAQTIAGSSLSHRSSGSGSGNWTLSENGYVGTYFSLAAPAPRPSPRRMFCYSWRAFPFAADGNQTQVLVGPGKRCLAAQNERRRAVRMVGDGGVLTPVGMPAAEVKLFCAIAYNRRCGSV